MIIDFHTHIFPDAIAARAIEALKDGMVRASGEERACSEHSDGTLAGLLNIMEASGVDISVVLPIATREKQTESINKFALKVTTDNRGKVISFGSLFPFQKDACDVLKRLSEQGFKGIKLHPEFQNFEADSKESIRILKQAEELGMMVVFHSGTDLGYTTPPKCTPKMLHNVLSEVSGKYIIAGHLGGCEMWDDVYKYLVGTDILLDTAFLKLFMDDGMYKKIIQEHGSDKVLFASDNPWENPADSLKKLRGLNLPEADMENILHKNAERILFGV